MALTDKLKGHLFKEVKVALDLQTGSVGWVANKGEAGEKVVSLRPTTAPSTTRSSAS
jgi:hypothetical protein